MMSQRKSNEKNKREVENTNGVLLADNKRGKDRADENQDQEQNEDLQDEDEQAVTD